MVGLLGGWLSGCMVIYIEDFEGIEWVGVKRRWSWLKILKKNLKTRSED